MSDFLIGFGTSFLAYLSCSWWLYSSVKRHATELIHRRLITHDDSVKDLLKIYANRYDADIKDIRNEIYALQIQVNHLANRIHSANVSTNPVIWFGEITAKGVKND